MSMETDPLLVGATRPTFVGGITYEAIIFCGMISSVIFLAANNVFLLPALETTIEDFSYVRKLREFNPSLGFAQTKFLRQRNSRLSFWY